MPSDQLIPPGPVIDPEDRPQMRAPRGGKGRPLLVRLLPILIVVVALGSFGGIVGYYYFASSGADGVAPLIKADQQPFKIKPDNPGGMEVPDQDKEIYNRVGQAERGSAPPPTAERLLPPPEAPLPRPAPVPNQAVSNQVAPNQPAPNPANLASPNPNLGGPVLGAPPTSRSSTLSAVPPLPPGEAPAPPPVPVTTPLAAAPAAPTATPTTRPAAASPAPAPQVAAATAPRPASGGPVVRVAIASLRSEAEARREWDRQRRINPDGLAGLVPEYAPIDLGARGVFWRIYVGPPEAGPEAQTRCGALKQKQVDCFVARP